MTGRTRRRGAQGFALILVLWFLVLIAAVAAVLVVNARSETAIGRNIRAAAAAEALADAGIAQAVFNLDEPVAARSWMPDGSEHILALPSGRLAIRVFDETAKINPNRASAALLAALFETVRVPRAQARRLGAAVADWVHADAQPRAPGAKADQYAAVGRDYAPPGAPVESLDELQLVLGMTPQIFAAVQPYLTIYTDSERPDIESASAIVRRALALESRENGDDSTPVPLPDADAGAQADAAPPAAPADAATRPERIVAVSVTARSGDGGVFVRNAVLKLDSDNARGYGVLEWRRGSAPE